MLVLRFRDLTIPDGETIKRHRDIIAQHGSVWWGWIMRQSEQFPTDLLTDISSKLGREPQEILLFHSGLDAMFRAKLGSISALPGGQRTRSPDLKKTPQYMRESVCPAWFCLTAINAKEIQGSLIGLEMPTRHDLGGAGLIRDVNSTSLSDLRGTAATLWMAEALT